MNDVVDTRESVEVIAADWDAHNMPYTAAMLRRLINRIEELEKKEIYMLKVIQHYNPDDALLDDGA